MGSSGLGLGISWAGWVGRGGLISLVACGELVEAGVEVVPASA